MIRPILTSLLILSIATTHAAAEAVPVKIERAGEPGIGRPFGVRA